MAIHQFEPQNHNRELCEMINHYPPVYAMMAVELYAKMCCGKMKNMNVHV